MLYKGLPVIGFAGQKEWERWLAEHHSSASGLWLKLAKKNSPQASVTYAQALESALCFGWIDGQKAALDEHFWLQRFTARGARSKWSQINREKATALIEQGRMRPAGVAEVERAKGDGRWQAAYAGQARASVPEDLRSELDRDPQALAAFQALNSVNRYAIIYRIEDAKLPQTRARRIEKYMAMLRAGELLHP